MSEEKKCISCGVKSGDRYHPLAGQSSKDIEVISEFCDLCDWKFTIDPNHFLWSPEPLVEGCKDSDIIHLIERFDRERYLAEVDLGGGATEKRVLTIGEMLDFRLGEVIPDGNGGYLPGGIW